MVWCELADPGETRVAVQQQADDTAHGLRQLIAALEMYDPERVGMTATEIVAAATDEIHTVAPRCRKCSARR